MSDRAWFSRPVGAGVPAASDTVASFLGAARQAELRALPPPSPDPFLQDVALQGSQIVALRLDLVQGEAGILFDLRLSEGYSSCDVGLMRLVGLDLSEVRRPSLGISLFSHGVETCETRPAASAVEVALYCWPRAGDGAFLAMRFHARSASFVAGLSPSIGDGPATYGLDADGVVEARTPKWSTEFAPALFGAIGPGDLAPG